MSLSNQVQIKNIMKLFNQLKVMECYYPIRWFVCLGFFVPLKNISLIWRRHHCQWRAADFDLCSALMTIQHWGFFSVSHLLWPGHSFIMVISKDPWHTHLLLSICQWSYNYLLRLRSVAAGIWTLSLPHAMWTLNPPINWT